MLNWVRCGIKQSSPNIKTVVPFSWGLREKHETWQAGQRSAKTRTGHLPITIQKCYWCVALRISVFCFRFRLFCLLSYESELITSVVYVRNALFLQASFHFVCTHVSHKHTPNCCFTCSDYLLRIEYIDVNTLYNNTLKIFQLHF